ncbi:unnamed protein product [Ixodes pacificus]
MSKYIYTVYTYLVIVNRDTDCFPNELYALVQLFMFIRSCLDRFYILPFNRFLSFNLKRARDYICR